MNNSFSWFLGLLATDGCISKPTYRCKGNETHITFCMQYSDYVVLQKVKKILGTRATVKLYPEYASPQCQLNIYDRKDIIEKYSDIKSCVPSEVIPRHYIRGLVDGDGCIHLRADRQVLRINIVNQSKTIIEYAAEKISSILSIPMKEPKWKESDHLYIVEWEGKVARLIAWWLYHGDITECVLDRKLDYYVSSVLGDRSNLGQPDEILMAIGHRGTYRLHSHGSGILVSMNTDSNNSLIWAKRMSSIIKRSTPVPEHRGKIKYYSLYIPVTDTRSIEIDEDIVR